MNSSALLVVLMLGAAPTPAGTPAPVPASFAGCYHLVFDSWQPPIVDSRWQNPPAHVRLDLETHPTPFQRGAFRVSFPRATGRGAWSAEWTPGHLGALSIVFVTQHSGISIRLKQSDNQFSGTASVFGEVYPKRPTASVSAFPEACAP